MRRAWVLAAVLLAVGAARADAAWLAGDLHVHSCFSHDAWCPDVDGPQTDEPWTLGLPVAARFAEASARGLDYLAVTDHNDLRSVHAPGFGSHGVVGVPGYEASLDGHAQALGARSVHSGDAAAVFAAVRADGGVAQVNHPGDGVDVPLTDCADPAQRDWQPGYDVRPDTIEVWNPTAAVDTGEAYLECWLRRGARVAATAGSDSHWATLAPVQGVGMPTTWVDAADRSAAGVLAALRAGRTSLTRLPPRLGGSPLLLEADRDRDGRYETQAIGADVAPGTPLRVRYADGRLLPGFVRARGPAGDLPVRQGLTDARFAAPAFGWARATLLGVPPAVAAALPCPGRGQAASPCAYDQQVLALTSPTYVVAP